MNAKVSIVVPVYNVEKYINKCVESLINQTYTNLEIILVDDGSTDRSGEICDTLAKCDKRIQVIHKKNGGLSDARNAGIDIFSGDYITFVDSDDYISNQMIEKMCSLLEDNDADLVSCAFAYIAENEEYIDDSIAKYNCEIYKDISILNNLDKIYTTAWAKLYRRFIFEDIRYPYGRYHEDEYVIHRILDKCKNVVYTNEPLYRYVKRDNSIMTSQNEKNVYDKIDAYCDRFKFYYTNGDIDNYKKSLLLYINFIQAMEAVPDNIEVFDMHHYSQYLRLHIWSKHKEIYGSRIYSFKMYLKLCVWCINPRVQKKMWNLVHLLKVVGKG